jgi:hypothetical protein
MSWKLSRAWTRGPTPEMGDRGRRVHDKDVLDALEAIGAQPFDGQVWRVTRSGRDPARGSAANGRWSPPGEFEVLYTSLQRDGALAEIGHRLSLEPVWPSKLVHQLHTLTIHAGRAVRLPDLQTLETLGVNTARYEKYDYSATQAIAAAAQFLGFDALIVPNARHPGLNLVGLLENLDPSAAVAIVPSEIVDWSEPRRRVQAPYRAASSPREGSPEEGEAGPVRLEQLFGRLPCSCGRGLQARSDRLQAAVLAISRSTGIGFPAKAVVAEWRLRL